MGIKTLPLDLRASMLVPRHMCTGPITALHELALWPCVCWAVCPNCLTSCRMLLLPSADIVRGVIRIFEAKTMAQHRQVGHMSVQP